MGTIRWETNNTPKFTWNFTPSPTVWKNFKSLNMLRKLLWCWLWTLFNLVFVVSIFLVWNWCWIWRHPVLYRSL